MRLSEQALVTASVHKLFNAAVTDAEEGVEVVPGANAEVADDRDERQLVRLESVSREFKNAEQVELIPEGINGFAVEVAVDADAVEFCAKTAEVRIETIARDLNIFSRTLGVKECTG